MLSQIPLGTKAAPPPLAETPARTSARTLPTIAIGLNTADWDLLFNAIKFRLKLCVGARDTADFVEANVLECVLALDQMQAALMVDRQRLLALELEAFDAKTALAQARAELVGTRAGERQARHQALHDGLTLLPNRRYFRERLEQALAHLATPDSSLAVLYLDLDGFKAINDSHGHDVGDEMLRIIAMRLNRVVRNEDMVSRLGGDEFACLRAGPINRQQLEQLAGKLFEAVAAPLKVGALELRVQPSVGIAVHPADGRTAGALLKNADLAMYGAKRARSHFAFRDQTLDGSRA